MARPKIEIEKPRKQTPRSSDTVTEQRIVSVVEFLLRGMNRREILQFVAQNEEYKWDVTASQIDNYIREAKKIIAESGVFNKDEEAGKAIERLNNLYRKAYSKGDFRACLAIQKELSELVGLKVMNIDHSGEGFVIKIVSAKDVT